MREVRHIPVLLDEVLEVLDPKPGQILVDCTLGLGGHSAELLRALKGSGKLIAIDFDPRNIEIAREKLAAIGDNFEIINSNFAALPNLLRERGIEKIDGLLADLGVASPHLDDPDRGFSFKLAGPLDMRMDPSRSMTAAQLVNTMSQAEMAKAFWELGDEEDAEKIAALIVEERAESPIQTTDRLNEIICRARDFTLKRAEGAKLHPSTRTFQVLRMLVNREIPNLLRLLDVLPQIIQPGGTAAIISFHSGEDRLVKRAFKDALKAGLYEDVAHEPIVAGEMEIRRNGRSRSAKLRWAKV